MKLGKVLIFFAALALLASGCSDKEKEAEKIEQDMAEMAVETTSMVDTSDALLDADMMESDSEMADESSLEMPRAPQGDGYAVQVSSATDESYAFYLVDLWTGRGYAPYVTTITYNDETHFRVRIGLYEAYSDANKLVAELEEKVSADVWIDQVSY